VRLLHWNHHKPVIVAKERDLPKIILTATANASSWNDSTFGMIQQQQQEEEQSQSQSQPLDEQQHDNNNNEKPPYGPMHIDRDNHTDEWIAETAIDARPLLPKAAFFIGDLRDGLPMVSHSLLSVCSVLDNVSCSFLNIFIYIYIYDNSSYIYKIILTNYDTTNSFSSSICKLHS
jgi:hypothetical protein